MLERQAREALEAKSREIMCVQCAEARERCVQRRNTVGCARCNAKGIARCSFRDRTFSLFLPSSVLTL